jgi:hypothetical protein
MGEWRYNSIILDLGTHLPLHPDKHWIVSWIGGRGGGRAYLDPVENIKILPCRKSDPGPPALIP